MTEGLTATVDEAVRENVTMDTPTASVLRSVAPPEFVGHPLDFRPPLVPVLADEGNVCIWRFRAEWKRLSRIDGMSSLSRLEAARVARFPKSAYSKRFAVGRAVLREILSGVTGVPAADIALSEDANGRPALDGLSISVAHAGLWIVIALSRFGIGLATASVNHASDTANDVQHAVRNASLRDAGVTSVIDTNDVCIDKTQSSFLFDAARDGHWHLVDLPMAGANLLTVSAPYPIRRVHAFGWTSSDGRMLTC